ncbi:uncharacterized protein LOC117618253 [Prunus dulcis]|uniref:uncharacterized protein LOC117618253 n=1 Tax=Prunus dulcis TaxID=3755 RepID=UPI001483A180|nr:uncharacterized protein LOC117618253 [Prunus dulcis]
MECSITMNRIAIRLAKAGFALYGIDYEGHGKSAGLEGYVKNFDDVVDDCTNHFTNICENRENKRKNEEYGRKPIMEVGGGANELSQGYSKGVGLGAEIIGTFVLVYTVFSATDPKRSAKACFENSKPTERKKNPISPLPLMLSITLLFLYSI